MKKIFLKKVSMNQFKNHVSSVFEFGSTNTIRGKNGQGKSSIGDSFTWALSGLDLMGNKLDPTPTDRESEKTSVSVHLLVDEKEIVFTHELVNGKNLYEINGVPTKATEFTNTVYSLTESNSVDMLFSLFNPAFFPSMHWKDQREMLLKYAPKPSSKEVFKEMPELTSEALKAAFKKHDISKLEALHKKNKTDKEKEIIAAKAIHSTLVSQLDGVEPQDLSDLEHELDKVSTTLEVLVKQRIEATDAALKRAVKKKEMDSVYGMLMRIREGAAKNKERASCGTCLQEITEETKRSVHERLNVEYKEHKAKYTQLKEEYDGILVPDDVDNEEIEALRSTKNKLENCIVAENKRLKAVETIDEAKAKVDDVQTSLNESIFLLDAIKDYQAKEADIQANKVSELFTGITIKLWDTTQAGDKKPTFEIELNGKPYRKLSAGEKVIAGMELIHVLTEQSGILVPTFIDNAESVTSTLSVPYQSIAAYAVVDQELEVKNNES